MCNDPTRHQSYVIETDPSTTPEYKIGYQHGAQGKPGLQTTAMGLQENYIAGYAAGYQEKRDRMTKANERTMITLRLKKDPRVVLPALEFDNRQLGWAVGGSFFSQEDWEPVPPPYALPTGLGAVVYARSSWGVQDYRYLALTAQGWHATNAFWDANSVMKDFDKHETISEGVKL